MTEAEIVKRESGVDQHFQMNAAPAAQPPESKPTHDLDSEQSINRHRDLVAWRDFEASVQQPSREQAAIDEGYRDHEQYTAEELQILADRNQAPAIANETKPIIDYMVGVERRMRIEGKALPREKGDRVVARAKTSLLKYLGDQNNEPMHRSQAFKEMTSAGLSWMYVGARAENEEGEAVTVRHESWRNVIHDSYFREMDYSDARYVFRNRFVDTDVAEKYFKDRSHILKLDGLMTQTPEDERNISPGWYLGQRLSDRLPTEAAMTSSPYLRYRAGLANSVRKRTCLTEAWWKEPTEVETIITPGPFFGQRLNEDDGALLRTLKKIGLKTDTRLQMVPYVAIMNDYGLLAMQKSPYRHNRFPLVPLICYRRSSDGAFYGVIRGIRDQQDLINKRRSKAVFLFSSNQIIIDKGAADETELANIRAQAAMPNGVIEVPRNAKRFELRRDTELAMRLEQSAVADKAYMREISGASTEALGQQSNATSGKAVLARQSQSGIVTAEIFDNYAFALKLVGELNLINAETFIPEARMVRVLNDRGVEQFTQINATDEQGNPINPITESRADFHLAMDDFRESTRRAAYEEMMDMLAKLAPTSPDIVRATLDLVVDGSDITGADQIAKRVRAITGQRDEDAVPSPEEQQQMAAQQADAKAKAELNNRAMAADVAMKEAGVQKLLADIELARSLGTKHSADQLLAAAKAIAEAIKSAQAIRLDPASAEVAAELIQGADAPGGNPAPTLPQSIPDQPAAPVDPMQPVAPTQPPNMEPPPQ